MPKIAIIDDRRALRETLKRSLDTELPGNWNSIDISPFASLESYKKWFTEQEISVVILDEKLREKIELVNQQINYEGHDFVDFIRKCFPTLSIFVVTTYPEDQELKKRYKDVEEIIPRKEFCKNAKIYVPRILRAGQNFCEAFTKELAELSEKAEKIAKGVATKGDMKKVRALQSKIGLMLLSDTFLENMKILDNIEQSLKSVELRKKKIGQYLKNEMEKDS